MTIERVGNHLNTLRPNKSIYYNLSTKQRDGISGLYQYFKDQKFMPIFPFPHTRIEKPMNAVDWYREAAKLQQAIIWNDFIFKAIYEIEYK